MNRLRFAYARATSHLVARGLVLITAVLGATPVAATTLEFEDLSTSQLYDLDAGTPGNPDSFVTGGVNVQLAEFNLPNGDTISAAAYAVDSSSSSNSPGGTGNYLFLGLMNAEYGLGTPASQLSFQFGEFAGGSNYANMTVNGSLTKLDSLFDLPANVGGAAVTVEVLGITSGGDPYGRVTLTGNIASFSVGGVEFGMDHVEFIPVPEPASAVLLAVAIATLCILRRRSWTRDAAARI